ncbi:MAG: tRNA (N(6)-L-threonylcarbamoyladenosine(37)-C(2))-methylthiotransferase MtaB [Bacillota bacterium]|nr:tRNA (N(6)-L-threonylcarbamoyladenosine(37)-C(2))-methylthiotransferase MtaB [Bacillota bacterium]
MKKQRAAFHTLGCKTNHYETDAVKMQFAAAGFELVPFTEPADIYLVNTCTVTAEADRKSRQMLRRARQSNAQALVVAMGCQATIGDAAAWADLVIDNDCKRLAVQRVLAYLADREPAAAPDQPLHVDHIQADAIHPDLKKIDFDEFGPVSRQSETRAYIKIEDGCNQFCSYCVIPLARGRVRSRSQSLIIREAEALAAAGYKEIVLTGIHICSYGADRDLPGHAVMELALELAGITGIERIRLGSLEPRFVTDTFIRLAAENPCLCPHFHLSLQSGSDRILNRMNRQYVTDDFRQVVAALRSSFPDPGITTDLIVGFPGETETDFAESLSFCAEMAFSRMHVFRFSPRDRTAAARMSDVVPTDEIARRSQRMISLATDLSACYHGRQVGKTHAVLVEKMRDDGLFEGYTPAYVPMRFQAHTDLAPGAIVQVAGTRAEADFLLGTQT